MSGYLRRTWRNVNNMPFPMLALLTVNAGIALSNGIAWGFVPAIVVGAALSAIFPWAIVAAWLIRRWRHRWTTKSDSGRSPREVKEGVK